MDTNYQKQLRNAGEPVDPIIPPTDKVEADAVIDVLNNTAGSFTNPPPEEQGRLGAVSQGMNATLGLVGAPFALMDTGFAMATAKIGALFPGLPAATLLMPHIGMPHAHAHPPSFMPPLTPVPIPLPSIGALMCPGMFSVLIGGVPAARAGDMGIAPTCCSFSPAFELFTGSSSVFVGGARAGRVLDITLHCNPISAAGAIGKLEKLGLIAGALTAGAQAKGGDALAAKMGAVQLAADAAGMVMAQLLGKDPGLPPGVGVIAMGMPKVLIGGFPMPDLMSMFGGLMKAAKKLGAAAKKLGKKKTPDFDPTTHKIDCRGKIVDVNSEGHPVDPISGNMYDEFVDFENPEVLFGWRRRYRSDWCDEPGPLGPGFRHSWEAELVLHRTRAVLRDCIGVTYEFPRGEDGRYGGAVMGHVLEQVGERRFVIRYRDTWTVYDVAGWRRGEAWARPVMVTDEQGRLGLEYAGDGRLAKLVEERAGLVYEVVLGWAGERIVSLERGVRGGERDVLARYEYDRLGRLERVVDVFGATIVHRYDENHRLVALRDKRDYVFRWDYDRQGRCVETWGHDGLWHAKLRYERGRTVATRADGSEWVHVFDDEGIIEAIVDPCGGIERYTRDERGRIVRQVTAGGEDYAWVYDEDGLHLGRMDQFGNCFPPLDDVPKPPDPQAIRLPETPFGWQWGGISESLETPNDMGVPQAILDRLGEFFGEATAACPVEPAPERDALGRVVARAYPLGATERFEVDAAGNLLRRWDRDGREWRNEIGSWNLVVAEQDPLGNVTRYGHDRHQNVIKVTDPSGNISRYEYDRCGRLVRVLRHGHQKERYEYDGGGHVIAKYDANDEVLVRYEVGDDGLDRARILSSGGTERFEYDQRGNFSRVINIHGGVTLSYDDRGRRLVDCRDGEGVEHRYEGDQLAATVSFGRFEVRYERPDPWTLNIHTPDGGQCEVRWHEDGYVLREHINGARELSHFDCEERCTGKVWWHADDAAEARWMRCTRTPAGDLIEFRDSVFGTTRYTYDGAHRVVGETAPDGTSLTIEYDRCNNITMWTGAFEARYGEGNHLEAVDGQRVVHDKRNNVSSLGDWRYVYDSLDRLTEVWRGGELHWEAGYDSFGRRLFKRSNGREVSYWWDGPRLAAERVDGGSVRVYVYADEEAIVPLMFVEYDNFDSSAESGDPYVIYTNHLGCPMFVEDRCGNLRWRSLGVRPYGELEVDPDSSVELNLRQPGHYWDAEIGLDYNRFRYYCPHMGRYIQSDPVGQGGGINIYMHSPNPLSEVDILGLSSTKRRAKNGRRLGRQLKLSPPKIRRSPREHFSSILPAPLSKRLRYKRPPFRPCARRMKVPNTDLAHRMSTRDIMTVLDSGDEDLVHGMVKALTIPARKFGCIDAGDDRVYRWVTEAKDRKEMLARLNSSPYNLRPGDSTVNRSIGKRLDPNYVIKKSPISNVSCRRSRWRFFPMFKVQETIDHQLFLSLSSNKMSLMKKKLQLR